MAKVTLTRENCRSRVWNLLLYPDCKEHMEVLEKIKKSYDYVGILHDKDFWTEKEVQNNLGHKVGELKKAHYHIVLRVGKNAGWRSALSAELNLSDSYIDKPKSVDKSEEYLVHYNDSDKYQYDVDECFGPMKSEVFDLINKGSKKEPQRALDLIAWLDNQTIVSVKDFAVYAAQNGYWDVFRRSSTIYLKILEEHNSCFGVTRKGDNND